MNLTVCDSLAPASLLRCFGQYLDEDIAAGKASSDTVTTYGNQLKHYFNWCQRFHIEPLSVDEQTIKKYRRYLVNKKYKVAHILQLVA